MPKHELIRGRIVDLRRHTNVHLYHRRSPGPSDRYELWLRDDADQELQVTIHTRTMPARRGHEVTVIESADSGPPTVVGLINWTTLEAVNYVEIDPPPLLRGWDLSVLILLCISAIWWFGNAAPGVALAAGGVWLFIAGAVRAVWRSVRARQVDVTITRVARVALRADSPLDPSPKAPGTVVAFRRKR
ncbi:hypothetical protein [uncultured Methylibium sp.]|uniref:hypothetical protein n=1 Tax=uncultured Methylibium sp. TaxID=381093 RepID=UPI0025F3D6FB|nr:hypothetical protein [uncultured Methylibium sp.]